MKAFDEVMARAIEQGAKAVAQEPIAVKFRSNTLVAHSALILQRRPLSADFQLP